MMGSRRIGLAQRLRATESLSSYFSAALFLGTDQGESSICEPRRMEFTRSWVVCPKQDLGI